MKRKKYKLSLHRAKGKRKGQKRPFADITNNCEQNLPQHSTPVKKPHLVSTSVRLSPIKEDSFEDDYNDTSLQPEPSSSSGEIDSTDWPEPLFPRNTNHNISCSVHETSLDILCEQCGKNVEVNNKSRSCLHDFSSTAMCDKCGEFFDGAQQTLITLGRHGRISTISNDRHSTIETDCADNSLLDLLKAANEKLKTSDSPDFLEDLLKAIASGRLDTNALTFKIISETIRAHTLDSLTQLRFSWQSKCFWKLFMTKCGGMAVRLLSGWKALGTLLCEETKPGRIDTEKADIILAIPNEDILRNFDPYGGDWPSKIEPGFCNHLTKPLAESVQESSVCISLDGKKITPGLKGDKGDINLLGMEEDGNTLEKKMKKLTEEQAIIKDLEEMLETYSPSDAHAHSQIVSKFIWMITLLSKHSISLQDEMEKKQYALEKLKKMGGEDYRTSRYSFVIQLLIAGKVELQECIDTGRQLREKLPNILACLQGKETLVRDSPVDIMNLPNYCSLHDIDGLLKSADAMSTNLAVFLQGLGPQYIRQRSSVWFSLRKGFSVTGSTLHAATGAGGLKAQREHFMQYVLGKEAPAFPPEVQLAIDHGQKYEGSAMATFCTQFLPSFLPEHAVYEIGGVPLDTKGIRMMVSPDGALHNSRTGKMEAVIEIKCPFTAKLHSSIPPRYYLQVQAEMMAMDVDVCFFVSYKVDSTRVFKVTKDAETWNLASECLLETFGNNSKKMPSRLLDSSKQLSDKIKSAARENCQLIAEVSSVEAVESNVTNPSSESLTTHLYPDPFLTDLPNINVQWDKKDATSVVETLSAHNAKVHQLLRKKATELITLVASDTDRLWSKNQLTGTPVCYFLKGYSLPMTVMRSILEDTLDKLSELKVHVPCVSFDGQFMKLLREDKNGNPQTMLQLQKQFWQSVTKMSKAAIMAEMKTAGVVSSLNDVSISSKEISGPVTRTVTVGRMSMAVVPCTSVRHIRVGSPISRQMESTEDDITDIAGEYPQDTEDILMEDLQQASSDMHSTVVEASATDRDELPDIPPVERSDPPLEDDQTTAPLMDTEFARLLNDMSQEHDSWKTKDLADLKQSFESCLELSKLKLAELKTVARFLKHGLNKNISLSGSKCNLINALKCCLKLGGQVIVKCRRKTAPTLKTLVARLLQGHKYPKAALNVSYAEWKFPDVIQKWQDVSMVRHGMSIPEVDPERQIDWFYVPEFATTRNQLEVKKIDPHHLLTRHRSAVCKGDLGNATRDHFIQVARDNSTTLKPGMMEQQLNMQSTDFAKITFSKKVQLCLEEKGHQDSAALCQFVRDWFAANDEPGISAVERCQMKLRYRDYLLSLVNLSSFPPPGSHIKGYPVPLWEATLASIDADFHMYAITKRRTYNNRALSSQPCESLYSCLATMPGAKNGVPSAVDLEVNMAKICGEFVVRQDPTRGFPTRLSSAPVYPQVLLEKEIGLLEKPATPPTYISEIIVQDHHFDAKGRRRLSRRDPRGISDPHEPGRGSAGVRQYHKVDESKLNPLIRAGIPVSS